MLSQSLAHVSILKFLIKHKPNPGMLDFESKGFPNGKNGRHLHEQPQNLLKQNLPDLYFQCRNTTQGQFEAVVGQYIDRTYAQIYSALEQGQASNPTENSNTSTDERNGVSNIGTEFSSYPEGTHQTTTADCSETTPSSFDQYIDYSQCRSPTQHAKPGEMSHCHPHT